MIREEKWDCFCVVREMMNGMEWNREGRRKGSNEIESIFASRHKIGKKRGGSRDCR